MLASESRARIHKGRFFDTLVIDEVSIYHHPSKRICNHFIESKIAGKLLVVDVLDSGEMIAKTPNGETVRVPVDAKWGLAEGD